MNMIIKIIGVIVLVFAVAGVLSLLLAWPFMWLWNYAVITAIQVVNPIEYWVAFWLMWFISLFLASTKTNSK